MLEDCIFKVFDFQNVFSDSAGDFAAEKRSGGREEEQRLRRSRGELRAEHHERLDAAHHLQVRHERAQQDRRRDQVRAEQENLQQRQQDRPHLAYHVPGAVRDL